MKFLESTWEQHFFQESQLLEDILASGGVTPTSSRLKIALEHNIIDWSKYSLWAQQQYLLPVLKRGLYRDQIAAMQRQIASVAPDFKKYDFAKYHMIVLNKWEDKVIILGMEPHEILNSGQFECIFVLTPPEIITTLMGEDLQATSLISLQIAIPIPPTPEFEVKAKSAEAVLELENPEKAEDGESNDDNENDEGGSAKETPLELPHIDLKENTVNFNELLSSKVASKPEQKPAVSVNKPKTTDIKPLPSDTSQYWNKISEDHNTLSTSVRKYFDGYAVLKISSSNRTELFKMDEELAAENLDPSLFNFNLNDASFFSNLLKTNTTDSISLKLLNITILDFNYVCATPLFLGDKPVGFVLGFKINAMNEQDETALFNLMRTG